MRYISGSKLKVKLNKWKTKVTLLSPPPLSTSKQDDVTLEKVSFWSRLALSVWCLLPPCPQGLNDIWKFSKKIWLILSVLFSRIFVVRSKSLNGFCLRSFNQHVYLAKSYVPVSYLLSVMIITIHLPSANREIIKQHVLWILTACWTGAW